jgi:hypothetical protein
MTIDEIVGLMIVMIWIGLAMLAATLIAGGLVVLLHG